MCHQPDEHDRRYGGPCEEPAITKPCTLACCVTGIQFAVARAQAGYRGAVTIPKIRRIRNIAGTMPMMSPNPGLPPMMVMAVENG